MKAFICGTCGAWFDDPLDECWICDQCRGCCICHKGVDAEAAKESDQERGILLDQVIDNSETGPDEITSESTCPDCGEYYSDCLCYD